MTDVSTLLAGDIDRAFSTLAAIATEFASQGRSPRAAAIKAAMQRRTDPPFDEGQYGFVNFRAFLKAAADAGQIALRPASVGPDVDVLPKNIHTLTPATAGGRIRRDVWDAFTRWDEGYVRFWDKEEQRAYRIPQHAVPGETNEVAAIRVARTTDPSRFVDIEHIPFATVVAWAREFAETLPPNASQTALVRALDNDLPVRNFTQLVRSLSLGPRWHDAHVTNVRQVVQDWAAEHDLTIDLNAEAGPALADVVLAHTVRSRNGVVPAESELRRQVHELVDRMTVPELLAIPVPLRLTLASQ